MKQNLYPDYPILIVDDEETALNSIELSLKSHGINNLIQCKNSNDAEVLIRKHDVKIVLLDLVMPEISGEKLLENIIDEYPDVFVVIVSGTNKVNTAVRCIMNGARDYIVKPIEINKLLSSVRHLIEINELRDPLKQKAVMLNNSLKRPEAFEEIITINKKMLTTCQYVEVIATTGLPVLITGETGVGKELIAKAIHQISGREGPFVAINISSIDDHTFNDTLFGHEKGAYTGADVARTGLIAKASGGTIFFDEIGDLSLNSQVKLLRLLQESEYMSLGSDLVKKSNIRAIFATHHNLKDKMEAQNFRSDLYYRLSTHQVNIPPLRERLDDLPILSNYFADEAATLFRKKTPEISPDVYSYLGNYFFPGNIRELKSMIFEAVSVLDGKTLTKNYFRKSNFKIEGSIKSRQTLSRHKEKNPFALCSDLPTIKEATAMLLDETLKRCAGKQTTAAKVLGITQQALSKRIKGKMS